jgi:hypothetical protein
MVALAEVAGWSYAEHADEGKGERPDAGYGWLGLKAAEQMQAAERNHGFDCQDEKFEDYGLWKV